MIDWMVRAAEAVQDAGQEAWDKVEDGIPTPPAEVVQACADLGAYLQANGWVSQLMPVWGIVAGMGVLLACIVAALAIRVARIALSVSTGGGGA